MIKQTAYESPIGQLLLAQDNRGICRIGWMNPEDEMPEAQPSSLLERAACELEEYFAGKKETFSFPLSMHGTAFEKRVWQALLDIPYGETRTYGQLAAQLGMPKGARAVGGACARNPLLIAVPCHRVIASSGALTGFAAGMQAKRSLLALEGHAIENNRIRT